VLHPHKLMKEFFFLERNVSWWDENSQKKLGKLALLVQL